MLREGERYPEGCSKLMNNWIWNIYIIHLLERTETNIIFIWSGKVTLGEAKPSPNITLSD